MTIINITKDLIALDNWSLAAVIRSFVFISVLMLDYSYNQNYNKNIERGIMVPDNWSLAVIINLFLFFSHKSLIDILFNQ